jgi:hypothetical protein
VKHKKLSLKISVLTVGVLLILMTPATVIHELGHSVVCVAHGFEQSIQISSMSAISFCSSGGIANNLFFRSFGGLLASVVLMAPLLSIKVRTVPWRFIPLIVLSISHAINAGIETLLYDYYISDDSVLSPILMMISLVLFFGLLFKYGRVEN